MHLVGKIWPVYRWDGSQPIFALLVPFDTALDELNLGPIPLFTEPDLKRALRDCDVATGDAVEGGDQSFLRCSQGSPDSEVGLGGVYPLRQPHFRSLFSAGLRVAYADISAFPILSYLEP